MLHNPTHFPLLCLTCRPEAQQSCSPLPHSLPFPYWDSSGKTGGLAASGNWIHGLWAQLETWPIIQHNSTLNEQKLLIELKMPEVKQWNSSALCLRRSNLCFESVSVLGLFERLFLFRNCVKFMDTYMVIDYKVNSYLSLQGPVHSTSPQGFLMRTSFVIFPRYTTWMEVKHHPFI